MIKNVLLKFKGNRFWNKINVLFVYCTRKIIFFSRRLRLRFLLAYLLIGALVAGTFLFAFLNEKSIALGHDLADWDNFVIVAIVLAGVLFVFYLCFFHLIGLYVYASTAFFVSLVFFVFTQWGTIAFDYSAFALIILFAVFGLIWQTYFFFSFKKYSWQKTKLLTVWKLYWKEHLFILRFYLVVFLFSWTFFVVGDLGSTLLGWLNVSIERNYFSPLGRTILMLTILSFVVQVLLFAFFNLALFFFWNRSPTQHLLHFGTLFPIRLFFQRTFALIRKRPILARPSTLLKNRLTSFWARVKLSFFRITKPTVQKTFLPMKNSLHFFVFSGSRWRLMVFFVFLLLLGTSTTFLIFALDSQSFLWEKSSFSLWKSTDLSVNPLVNEYDRESYFENILWEAKRAKLAEDAELFDINNFRVVPIVNDDGKWTYAVDFLTPLSAQNEQFLETQNFTKVNIFNQYLLTIWFDLKWILLTWAVAMAIFMITFALFFGLEYGLLLPLSSFARFFVIATFAVLLSGGADGRLLKLLIFLLPFDLFCALYLYNFNYQKNKWTNNVNFIQRYYLPFFFVLVVSAVYLLLGYSWNIFAPLLLVVALVYLSSFTLDFFICQHLKFYKIKLFTWIRKKLFLINSTAKTETVIPGLND